MSLHDWFGRHVPAEQAVHWHGGHYACRCSVCGREMIRLPGLPWKLRQKSA